MDYKEICRGTLTREAFLIVNKKLMKEVGIEEAVFLSDLISKEAYFEENKTLGEDGYFWNTQSNIKETTGLAFHKQTDIIKKLKEKNLLFVKSKGLPAKNYFKINYEGIVKVLEQVNEMFLDLPRSIVLDNNNNIIRTNDQSTIVLHDQSHDQSKTPLRKLGIKRILPSESIRKRLQEAPHPKPVEKQTKIPVKVQELLDYWKEQNLHIPAITTKEYSKGVKKISGLLNGTYFKGQPPLTLEDIKLAISRFSTATFDLSVFPENKSTYKKLSFSSFIDNPFASNGNGSLFKKYLEDDPQPISKSRHGNSKIEYEMPKDEYPELTKAIKISYSDKVLNGTKINFIGFDEENIRKSATELNNFVSRNPNLFKNATYQDMADMLVQSVVDSVTDKEITTGYLCSYVTINNRLPKFIRNKNNAKIEYDNDFDMYDKTNRNIVQDDDDPDLYT
jgi:hypothetical protein